MASIPRFSIVVPAYNVFKYLSRGIRSLLEQTFQDYEILLIENGSTDGTRELCDSLCQLSNKILLRHYPKIGLGPARNVGIRLSRGQYILFMDGDDALRFDALEIIDRVLHNYSPDLISFGYQFINQGTASDCRMGYKFGYITDQTEIINNCFAMAPMKAYSRELALNIIFPKMFHEDEYVISNVLFRARSLYAINESLYLYYQRSDSIMHTPSLTSIRDFRKACCRTLLSYGKKEIRWRHTEMYFDILVWNIPNSKIIGKFIYDNRPELIDWFRSTKASYRKAVLSTRMRAKLFLYCFLPRIHFCLYKYMHK